MKKHFLFLMVLSIVAFSSAAVIQAGTAATINLSMSAAKAGDRVAASGVSAPDAWIAVKIMDGSGNIAFFDVVKSDSNGRYSCDFTVPNCPGKTLDIMAGYGSNVASASLTVDSEGSDTPLPVMGGTVTISGEVKYGETLTADISAITYTPGTSDDVPAYQWKRGGANIAGATASTYTLVQADIGQTITVTVTADGVHATGSVTISEDVPAPSDNADLSGLTISSGTLCPGFDPSVTTYLAGVGHSVSGISVTPTTADSKAVVTVNGTGVASGSVRSVSLGTGDNIITIVVTDENGTAKTYKITVHRASSGGSGGGNSSGGNTPASGPASDSKITININGSTIATATASMDSETGTVTAVLNANDLNNALAKAKANEQGIVTVNIGISKTTRANSYVTELPATVLAENDKAQIEIKTVIGTITVPGNMLGGSKAYGAGSVGLSIGAADKSGFNEELKAQIGDKPVIELKLTSGGNTVLWNNPDAPVTVSIPYTPTAEELANPDGIVIWYIDGSGNAVSVPNGHYDPATGTVNFTTTHFSLYAVCFKQVSFKDVPANAWYSKAVSFSAAREITKGTGNGNFSPEAKLTRGQFIVMLMKAYGITPDVNPVDNFADAGSTYYTGYLAAAKRLGISAGVGNNLFAPEKETTRQEMFTLLYNALKTIGKLPQGNSGKLLSNFSDANDIAPWAKEAMKLLVETGTTRGSSGKLASSSTTTRAEMVQVLYSLFSK